jgi:hypothetical protein
MLDAARCAPVRGLSAALMSVVMGTLQIARAERPVRAGYRRTPSAGSSTSWSATR